ncbi:unnamed protein product [Dovyalis caffra]|uniref:Uncharacterized protein n=1 Tax=Dovyalis caffra TaxID=77055 RepID=A0AAV1QQR5_9ROSI|nr:unnamed protein product [Dovyalis caffra]
MAEFAYNSSVNQSIEHDPFASVTSMLPRKPIDLVSLPIETRPSIEAKLLQNIFTTYMVMFVERLLLTIQATNLIWITKKRKNCKSLTSICIPNFIPSTRGRVLFSWGDMVEDMGGSLNWEFE